MPRKSIIAPLLALVAALSALGLAACGGGGGNDEDPQDVLEQTFEAGKDYSSGVMDLDFKLSTEGTQQGALNASLNGPFQSTEGGFPQFDLAADFTFEGGGQNFGFTGGLVSTGQKAFINFQDTDYAIDARTFTLFKDRFLAAQKQSEQEGSAFSINPAEFLTGLENEGSEDIEGTETIHVAGTADVNKLADAVQGAPGAEALPGAGQLDQLREQITEADFHIYTGEEDKRLRKLETTVTFEPQAGASGAGEAFSLNFALTFSALGEDQTVQAPSNARPLRELLERYQDDLGGLLGGLGQQGGGTGEAAPVPPSSGESQEYLKCIQEAQGEEELQACAESLQ